MISRRSRPERPRSQLREERSRGGPRRGDRRGATGPLARRRDRAIATPAARKPAAGSPTTVEGGKHPSQRTRPSARSTLKVLVLGSGRRAHMILPPRCPPDHAVVVCLTRAPETHSPGLDPGGKAVGARGGARFLPRSARLRPRYGGDDVIFLEIFFDKDLVQFTGFRMRYHSTPAADVF